VGRGDSRHQHVSFWRHELLFGEARHVIKETVSVPWERAFLVLCHFWRSMEKKSAGNILGWLLRNCITFASYDLFLLRRQCYVLSSSSVSSSVPPPSPSSSSPR
jgi:hypothetical protein